MFKNLRRRDPQKLQTRRGQDLIAFDLLASSVFAVARLRVRPHALIAAVNYPVSRNFQRRVNRSFKLQIAFNSQLSGFGLITNSPLINSSR